MKIIKYTFVFAIVGFVLGLLISICTVGCNDTLRGGSSCINKWCEGCLDFNCYEYICEPACGVVVGSTCAAVGFLEGCISCDGCISGCIDGFKEGYSEFGSAGVYSCDVCNEGCKECNDGCKTDATDAYINVVSNFKAKGYIIYLTIIGAFLGTVFGIAILIQERKRKEREVQAEKERKEREVQAEKERKEREVQAEKERKEREVQAEKERKEREVQASVKERQHESYKKWIEICKVLMPEKGYELMPEKGYELMPEKGYELMPEKGYEEKKQLTEKQKNELKEQEQELQKIYNEKEKKDEEFRRSLEEARKRDEKVNEIKQIKQRKKQKWYFIIIIILIIGGIIYCKLNKNSILEMFPVDIVEWFNKNRE